MPLMMAARTRREPRSVDVDVRLPSQHLGDDTEATIVLKQEVPKGSQWHGYQWATVVSNATPMQVAGGLIRQSVQHQTHTDLAPRMCGNDIQQALTRALHAHKIIKG